MLNSNWFAAMAVNIRTTLKLFITYSPFVLWIIYIISYIFEIVKLFISMYIYFSLHFMIYMIKFYKTARDRGYEMEENQNVRREIGARLTEARKKKRLKQVEAAERLGLLQSNLSAIERGKAKLSLEVLVKACRLYNVYADFILFNREVIETNDYLNELLNLATVYDDVLYKLDKLETIEQVEEVRQFINSLLMPSDEYED